MPAAMRPDASTSPARASLASRAYMTDSQSPAAISSAAAAVRNE